MHRGHEGPPQRRSPCGLTAGEHALGPRVTLIGRTRTPADGTGLPGGASARISHDAELQRGREPSNARRAHQGCRGPSGVGSLESGVRSQDKAFTHHFAGLYLRGSVSGLRGSLQTTGSEREASLSPPRLLLPSCPRQMPRRGGHATPTVRAASPYRPGVPSTRPVRMGRAVPSTRPVRTGRAVPRCGRSVPYRPGAPSIGQATLPSRTSLCLRHRRRRRRRGPPRPGHDSLDVRAGRPR